MYITTNKIPNYEYVAITPNALEANTETYKISLTPQVASHTTDTDYQLGADAFESNEYVEGLV